MATIFKVKIQRIRKRIKRSSMMMKKTMYGRLGSNFSSENYEHDKHDEFATINDLESWKRKVTLEIFSI